MTAPSDPPHSSSEAPPSEDFGDFALAAQRTPLAPVIAGEIRSAGGRITFERFMALALGHPEHGYYARAGLRWGAAGDFETSPEVHPVFGYLWARQVLECWERLGRPPRFDLVEVGAGSGAFSSAMLTWLRERAPECFAAVRPWLLDGHPRRIEEQRAALASAGLEARHATFDEWAALDEPREGIDGVVISNELFDALPVHLVRRVEGSTPALIESYVALEASGALELVEGPPSTPDLERHFERLGTWPGEGCRAEVSLAAPEVMRQIASRLGRGYVVSIDYGYEAAELYASWRRAGTLLAFRNHSPQPDILGHPGLTDLTSHVDFTSLRRAAEEVEDYVSSPLVTQAEALVALGLGNALEAARAGMGQDMAAYASARRAADTLVDPHGLGRIRVLVLARGAALDGLRCLRTPLI